MNPERFAAWQAGLQARDQAMIMFAILAGCGLLVWLAWGRETAARRRLVLAGWWLLEAALMGVGLWASCVSL